MIHPFGMHSEYQLINCYNYAVLALHSKCVVCNYYTSRHVSFIIN
jgi:hypothetical protein